MADPRCVVTAPLPVAAGLGFGGLATVVAADALVRRAWALGRATELLVPALEGDLASQHAFERELAREGHDLDSLDPPDLEARRQVFQEDRRLAAGQTLAQLSVAADVGASATNAGEVGRAARTAFVKLYEEGLIDDAERVVATCPRCRTVLDAVDTEPGEIDGERLILRLVTTDGREIEVHLGEPELLPGAVAVAVPEGSASVGAQVAVPLSDRTVPVVASTTHVTPGIVVAAHDGDAYALASSHGLVPIPVLDADGTIQAAGPLEGLGRYAARAEAKAILEADGVVVDIESMPEEVWRCRACGTVLVPQLGRHWFLRAGELEVAAADAIRDGLVGFSPPDARDAFLASAGVRTAWCLTSTVAGGVELPVSRCLDCGKVSVEVEVPSSCGKCMGVLMADAAFLDARFLAAIWAVALGGWPGRGPGVSRPDETLAVVSSADLVAWALPAIALGLRLAGVAPFAGAIVHPWPDLAGADVTAFVEADLDRRVARLALVGGTDDLGSAAAAVAALDRPVADDVDAVEAAEAAGAGVAALDEGSPAQAAGLLASALRGGVPADAAERIRALALPILGD